MPPSGDIDTRYSTVDYNSKYRFITQTTDPLSQTISRTYEPAFGNVWTETGIDGQITANTYDGFGRLKTSTSPTHVTSTVSYHWVSGSTPTNTVYYSTLQTPDAPETQKWYDVFGRELQVKTDGFDGSDVYAKKEYNALGQLYRQSDNYYSGGTVKWTTFAKRHL